MAAQVTSSNEIDTVVVGGGQAGLSMSYHLAERGIPHVVLERARIGERWRTERWDSLRFQFPSRYVRLPGFDYDGEEPTGFMDREGIVDVIERYANHINAPVRCGVNVRALERASDGDFVLITDQKPLHARNVILATGPYQRPLVPTMSAQVPARIRQLNANSFTNADALPMGAVLIVGSGASGVQIAEDLLANGRDTYLCVGQHKRLPRSFKGRDIMDWMEELGMTYELVRERPEIDHSPLLTGVDGGYDVDLRQFDEQGGHLLGRLEAVRGDELILGDGLLRDIANADESYYQTLNMLAARVAEQHGSAAPTPLSPPAQVMPAPSPASVNLASAGITSIIWATGYGLDFSWVSCGDFNDDDMPKQERGVSTVPGLYFLGLPFMYNARSSFFWGVGEDAEYVAEHLAANRMSTA